MIIYKATNLINGKCYIGKTIKTLEERKSKHRNSKTNQLICRAIQKYGFENFQWEILKDNITNPLMLNLLETFMIMVHHSHVSEGGYNMTWGGDGGDTLTNNPNIIEIKKKLSKNKYGKGNSFYNKTHTIETKQKLSEKNSGENSILSKKYIITDKDNNVFIVHGLRKFCKENNLQQQNMCKVAAGIRKKHKGLTCKHYDNITIR